MAIKKQSQSRDLEPTLILRSLQYERGYAYSWSKALSALIDSFFFNIFECCGLFASDSK